MPEDKAKTRPQDARLINVHDRYAVEYWTKKFGVTEERLKAAVAKAGTSAKAMESELKRRWGGRAFPTGTLCLEPARSVETFHHAAVSNLRCNRRRKGTHR